MGNVRRPEARIAASSEIRDIIFDLDEKCKEPEIVSRVAVPIGDNVVTCGYIYEDTTKPIGPDRFNYMAISALSGYIFKDSYPGPHVYDVSTRIEIDYYRFVASFLKAHNEDIDDSLEISIKVSRDLKQASVGVDDELIEIFKGFPDAALRISDTEYVEVMVYINDFMNKKKDKE